VIAALCEQLRLPVAAKPIALREALDRVAQGRVEQYGQLALPEPVLAACRRLDEVQAIALRRRGSCKE